MNNSLIFNIKSNYCIKLAFSYLKYDSILQLIKINKKLQNLLNISHENYFKKTKYSYITKKFQPVPNKEDYYKKEYERALNPSILFILVFGVLLLELNMIFIFIIFFLIYFIRTYFGKNKIINKIMNFISFISFCICLVLTINYLKFADEKTRLNFIILILYDIICIYRVYEYFWCFYIKRRIIVKNILLKINDININKNELSNNFHKMSDKQKKNYILKNLKNFKISMNDQQIDIINHINEIRLNNNKSKLEYNKRFEIYDFILNEVSEFYFFPFKKIVMLSKGKYLIKCFKEELKEQLNNNNIMKILMMEDFNRISIIESGIIIYILIYESFEPLNDNDVSIENNSLNEPVNNEEINYRIMTEVNIISTYDKKK